MNILQIPDYQTNKIINTFQQRTKNSIQSHNFVQKT